MAHTIMGADAIGTFAADAIVNNARNNAWFHAKEEFYWAFRMPRIAQLTPSSLGASGAHALTPSRFPIYNFYIVSSCNKKRQQLEK